MTAENGDFSAFEKKMLEAQVPGVAIRNFAHYYSQLVERHTGLIAESDIDPVDDIPDADSLSASLDAQGTAALSRTVMVKLNGGLGTGMGLDKAKSLLVVKDGETFLDIIAKQALRHDVPLVLMNSFSTRDDSLAALARYPELAGPIPLDFMQHKVPKILVSTLSPALSPDARHLEWCPPGHGDLYTALVTSGMLDTMLAAGLEYLFVSNADNLGAVIDTRLLGHFAREDLPFMMEVADRTPADRKGGHLAKDHAGRLLLRESAQCPDEDVASFQDIERHRYFNTNNLWINLQALKALLDARGNVLGLAMIRNQKTLDPRDPNSPAVYQLETAMGSAIAAFEGACAVRVPRTRFAPVKTTSDLLAIRSDSYLLSEDFRILPSPDRSSPAVVVDLDPAYFRNVDDLDARFPCGPPSLIHCEHLRVVGDVRFEANVICEGRTAIVNESAEQAVIAAGTRCVDTIVL